MDAPEAQYLERDGALLAFQTVGDRGADVLWVGELAQHFDLCWTDPYIHELYERSASYSRTTYMQMRGFGLSERIRYTPTIDQHADDVLAVIEAAGMRNVTLAASLTTASAVALAAAREPGRVAALVLFKPLACGPLAPDAAKHGWNADEGEQYAARWRAVFEHWGSGESVGVWDPVQGTAYNKRLMAMLERCSATPAGARGYLEYALRLDITDVLRTVSTPTRVLYSADGFEPEGVVRRVAELVPDATFHALPRTPPGAAIGEAWIPVWDHVHEVVTGAPQDTDVNRFLGTVLFTDVVGSTELLSREGDARYRELRSSYERQVRLQVERAGGRLVSVVGDGTFSIFDSPTKAVRCAEEICSESATLGIAVRAGLHTGEMERTGHDVTGLAVHIGARVAATAGAGEVVVSRTVRDLVAGSGLSFAERGRRQLKGVPEEWELYALSGTRSAIAALPVDGSLEKPLDRVALRTARTAPGVMRAALRVGNAVERYRARKRPTSFAP